MTINGKLTKRGDMARNWRTGEVSGYVPHFTMLTLEDQQDRTKKSLAKQVFAENATTFTRSMRSYYKS